MSRAFCFARFCGVTAERSQPHPPSSCLKGSESRPGFLHEIATSCTTESWRVCNLCLQHGRRAVQVDGTEHVFLSGLTQHIFYLVTLLCRTKKEGMPRHKQVSSHRLVRGDGLDPKHARTLATARRTGRDYAMQSPPVTSLGLRRALGRQVAGSQFVSPKNGERQREI